MDTGRAEYRGMSQSAPAATTEYHRLGGFNSRLLSLTILEARRPRQQIQFLVRALSLTCRQLPSCWPSLGQRTLLSFSSFKDTNAIMEDTIS